MTSEFSNRDQAEKASKKIAEKIGTQCIIKISEKESH